MLPKAITTLLYSLAATAGFSYMVATFCDSKPASADKNVVEASIAPTFHHRALSSSQAVRTVNAFPELTFDAPVEFTYAPDESNKVYVIEQSGRIRQFENSPTTKSATLFLDIRKKVASGGEMGLLGLAFHPKFRENGYFYVNYTKDNPRETVISRFNVNTQGNVDPASETILLTFAQPYSNHNGGKLAFGPDGYLYIATGDGGSGGDPKNNGQNRSTLLGKILRIDVNKTDKGQYGIPTDNPFAANKTGFREEIYAFGLRNPWRFSFDAENGQLWVGDVGQNETEEIDIVAKGGNYGWRLREANRPYNSKDNTDPGNLIDPIHEYAHGADGNSVTGGYVYRGTTNPTLRGKYIYGDFGSGRIWALSYTNSRKAENQLLLDRSGSPAAFGEDARHELYICDYSNGKILRLASQ